MAEPERSEWDWRVGIGVAAAASLALAVAIGHSSDNRLWERVWSRSLAQVGAQSRTNVDSGAAGRGQGGGAPENASHVHRKLALPVLSAARVDADPVQSLRMCLLDKGKMARLTIDACVAGDSASNRRIRSRTTPHTVRRVIIALRL